MYVVVEFCYAASPSILLHRACCSPWAFCSPSLLLPLALGNVGMLLPLSPWGVMMLPLTPGMLLPLGMMLPSPPGMLLSYACHSTMLSQK